MSAAANGRVTLISANPTAQSWQRDAEQAFRQQRYDEALRLSRHALLEDDQNGLLLLFGSQAAFAAGQYAFSYDALARGIELLPDKSQWGFVVENYRQLYSNSDYVTQMERLESFAVENAELGYPLTLRAFHFLYLGHQDAARSDLEKALALNPDDYVARQLFATLPAEQLPVPSKAIAPVPAPSLDAH